MTNRYEKQKQTAEELLTLRQRHKESAWECPAGHRPLSLRDPLARAQLADVGDEDICPDCRAKLESVGQVENEDFIPMLRPRGTDAAT